MKVNVLKYVGVFSGSEANGLVFPRGVPTLVSDSRLYDSLKTQPDFVESTLAELESYVEPVEAVVLTGAAVPLDAAQVDTSETTTADTAATGPTEL